MLAEIPFARAETACEQAPVEAVPLAIGVVGAADLVGEAAAACGEVALGVVLRRSIKSGEVGTAEEREKRKAKMESR